MSKTAKQYTCNVQRCTLYTVSKKTAKLFLSELHQISTNGDNFGIKMAKRLRRVHLYLV